MSDTTRITSVFNQSSETMQRCFYGWESDLPHQGEKGGIRERRVSDFLSAYLPKRYGIGTGHIIDRRGNISTQIDIVIYDAVDGIAIPIDNYYSLFPCECVYAVIEVKSRLTAYSADKEENLCEIRKCLKNTTIVKSLYRGEGISSINSFVFAYETQWKREQWQNVAKMFYIFGKKYNQQIPEMVLVLDNPGFALTWSKLEGEQNKDRYSHLFQKNPLLFFFSELLNRLEQTRISLPNLWSLYGNWIGKDIITTIIPDHAYPEI
jgi:hypothetical protein